jgi:hypothetical protein
MFKITRKSRLVKVAAAAAAIGSLAAIGFAGSSPANADPKQYTDPIFGFGSDTLQDITNAFAGANVAGTYVAPLQSSAATGAKQIVSWDAFPPGAADPSAASCIQTKVGSPTILRPNGSSNGLRALSAAYNSAQTWPLAASSSPCGARRSMGGIIDFARSSSTPTTTTGPLLYIPFGRDALSFAYVRPSGSPVVSLTRNDLIALHATGPQLIGGVPVIACGIQTGSGTYRDWMGMLGRANDGTGDAGTNTCNNVGTGTLANRIQENNGPDLTGKSTFLSSMTSDICDGVAGGVVVSCENAQLVVGFSASQFVARSNGVGTPNPNLGANGGLGAIDGVAFVSGTAPNVTANAAGYANTTFGRDVSYVFAAEAILGDPTFGIDPIPHLVDMFVGTGSKVCSQSARITQFGFLPLGAACGSTTFRSNFRTT